MPAPSLKRPLAVVIAVLGAIPLTWLVAGCGGGGEQPKSAASSPPSTPSKPTAATTDKGKPAAAEETGGGSKLAAEGWGTLTGQVVLKGDVPELKPLDITKDKEVCEKHRPPNEKLVVDPQTKGIRDVFIYLPRKPSRIHEELAQPKEKEVVFDQKDCHFLTHALAMRSEQTLMLKSSDPVGHNTNIQGGASISMNTIIQAGSAPIPAKISRPMRGNPVPITCNIHQWMSAWLLAVDHPYFAVTDAEGRFTIEKLPAGALEFRVWHETGYVVSPEGGVTEKGMLKVTIEPDKTTEVNIPVDSASLKPRLVTKDGK